MNLAFALVGLMVLIVIHEAGHMLAAKAVGMKVERFALFFPPLLFRRKVGETEYAIGAIPLGGYVKVLGQNPDEEVAPEDLHRSFPNQAIWRRAVMIAAGPFANLVTCLLLLVAVLMIAGRPQPTTIIEKGSLSPPASTALKAGDRIISVDGITGSADDFVAATRKHTCAGGPVAGCKASTPAVVKVRRGQAEKTFELSPVFDPKVNATRLGFSFAQSTESVGPFQAVGLGASAMWSVTTATIGAVTGIADPAKRKQLGSVVGGVAVTEQAFSVSLIAALELLAFISLSLAVVNLFPLLPLDGGHLFWLAVEKVRGRPASRQTLERATVVGFALVLALFMVGLSNDIGHLASDGFRLSR